MFGHSSGHMPDGVIVVALFLLGVWLLSRVLDWIEEKIKSHLRARRERDWPPSTKF